MKKHSSAEVFSYFLTRLMFQSRKTLRKWKCIATVFCYLSQFSYEENLKITSRGVLFVIVDVLFMLCNETNGPKSKNTPKMNLLCVFQFWTICLTTKQKKYQWRSIIFTKNSKFAIFFCKKARVNIFCKSLKRFRKFHDMRSSSFGAKQENILIHLPIK